MVRKGFAIHKTSDRFLIRDIFVTGNMAVRIIKSNAILKSKPVYEQLIEITNYNGNIKESKDTKFA